MFKPKRVLFEKGTLDTEVGQNIYNMIKDDKNIEVIKLTSNKIKGNIPGENLFEQYREGKETMVVSYKKSLKFQTCKPSANYQLPLVSGCMGRCEYCYLNTQLGDKPFVRVFVNTDEILEQAKKYIDERSPHITIFEGAATSDPIPIEPYTHSLKKTIEFLGKEEKGRFRFVTKFNDIDTLLDAKHNNHTEIRFSINTQKIIREFEHGTDNIDRRLEAAKKVKEAGYNLGFIIAPVFIYPNWKEEYLDLLDKIKKYITTDDLMFEVISHRFTGRAKERILEVYPNSKLPMNEEERKYKYGQFGYGKFVYPKEELNEMKEFFKSSLEERFGDSSINYII